MKTVQRSIALILLLALCLAALPLTVMAADLELSFSGKEGESGSFVLYSDTSDPVSGASITSGSVPGMELNLSGNTLSLKGTPTSGGSYTVTVAVTTASGKQLAIKASVNITKADAAPSVTKQPTGEKIVEGESAAFVARADNTVSYSWELLTKSGTTYRCKDLPKYFPDMKVTGSDTERVELFNIPLELDGAKVRCQFTGTSTSIYSDYAVIEVLSLDEVTPVITKDPTGETVKEGDTAKFVAKADYVKQYIWVLISPDGKTTYDCSAAGMYFPGLTVSGSDTERLVLENIPAELDGWLVQCKFVGGAGTVVSKAALITVEAEPTEAPTEEPTEAPTEMPTEAPTEAPTEEPTEAPTEAPTEMPTEAPTEAAEEPSSEKEEKKSGGGTLILILAVALVSLGAGASGAMVLMNLKRRDWDD